MFAVERLGSYISRGVSTVSSPFQPYGGAVDIIVVEQPDGTYKSGPWYVRFGKSQGAMTAVEKVVYINVNGVDAGFHMYLDNYGDAYFLREVDGRDGEWQPYPCSGDEKDLSPGFRRMQKSKSCDYDANRANFVSEFETSDTIVLKQTNSHPGGLFGVSFGRRSMHEGDPQGGEGAVRANQLASLERAEMAADLMEVRWTTNLETGKKWGANPPQVPKPKLPVTWAVGQVNVGAVRCVKNSSMNGEVEDKLDSSVSYGVNGASCAPSCEQSSSNKERDAEIPCSVDPGNYVEICAMEETHVGVDVASDGRHIPVSECLKEPKDRLSVKRTFSEPVCTILTDELDTKDNQNPYPGVLPTQGASTKEDNVENIASCNGDDKTLGSMTRSENLEEEEFFFNDLDDCKLEKVDQVGVLHPDDEPEDSSKSSEEDVTETTISGEPHQATDKHIQEDKVIVHSSPKYKSKQVSSPINVPKYCNDAEEEFITPAAESLPSMLLTGNNTNQHGVPQHLSRSLDSNFGVLKMVNNDAQVYPETIAEQQLVPFTPKASHISKEIKSIVSDPAVEVSLCRHLLYEGMGYEAASLAFDAEKLEKDKFASLCPDIVKNDKLVVRIGGIYFPWDAALPIASAIGSQGREQVLEAKGMIPVGEADKSSLGNPQKNMNPRNGSWKLWPFSLKRMSSEKDTSLFSESTSADPIGKNKNVGKDETIVKVGNIEKNQSTGKDENSEKDGSTEKGGNTNKNGSTEKKGNTEKGENADVGGSKVTKKKIRAKTPTSEQLHSLKLKEGKNVVTFSFTAEMLGKQQVYSRVDARIFLWKWDTRIVISDVDGTITKSDVLGHVMPLMGIDWSQTGVTRLFTAIRENGYQLLFLSARSILQASTTRQFLISLKQDGKALPEGPIVISPDGLFPSLYREVIRRAPHEFKISCLEDIKALFPQDHNPFYAGFGNRDTDELSYLKVGIPKGKIFTINPKGEVAVNRRVATKSYTSLHALVHDMFPETPVIEQEDYNSWNFWRLPPPDFGI